MSEEKKQELSFLTAVSLSTNDVDGKLLYLQFSVFQDTKTKEVRCFFDVVDPTKIKLKEPEDVLP